MTATNDRELRRAMHRMLQSVQPSPTPVDAIIQRGKKIRLRSRRRAWAAAATVAVAVVAFIIPARIGAPGHGPRSAGRQRPATDYLADQVERELTRTITPISTATNRVRRPIPGRYFPAGIAITPDGKTAYVLNGLSGTVIPISTATNTPGKPIKVGIDPGVIAITPDGKTAYVANDAWARSPRSAPPPTCPAADQGRARTPAYRDHPGREDRLRRQRHLGHGHPDQHRHQRAWQPIKVGLDPGVIAITPDGKTAYVANDTLGTVTPISTATNVPGKPIKVGPGPGVIAITPDGKTAYVVLENDPRSLSGTVIPISTATSMPGKPIKVGPGPGVIAITPDGKTACVVGAFTVTPISTATNTPGKPIYIGSNITIAITPDSKTVYAATWTTAVPISTATNVPGNPIRVGPEPPAGITITP